MPVERKSSICYQHDGNVVWRLEYLAAKNFHCETHQCVIIAHYGEILLCAGQQFLWPFRVCFIFHRVYTAAVCEVAKNWRQYFCQFIQNYFSHFIKKFYVDVRRTFVIFHFKFSSRLASICFDIVNYKDIVVVVVVAISPKAFMHKLTIWMTKYEAMPSKQMNRRTIFKKTLEVCNYTIKLIKWMNAKKKKLPTNYMNVVNRFSILLFIYRKTYTISGSIG